MVYEKEQRPADKRHLPWMERVAGQANAAYGELEHATRARGDAWLQGDALNAADIAVACAWRFGQYYNAVEVPAAGFPALVAHSKRAEALPEFVSTPLD
jgi:glutathione S-transferase